MLIKSESFIKSIVKELISFPEIEFAYLFGSVVRKGIEKAEDVDLGIFFSERLSEEDIVLAKLKLESILSGRIGKEFEVTPLNLTSDPLFIHQVLKNKRLLVDRNHTLRLIEEAKWRNEYFDMQPLWKEYRRKVFGFG